MKRYHGMSGSALCLSCMEDHLFWAVRARKHGALGAAAWHWAEARFYWRLAECKRKAGR